MSWSDARASRQFATVWSIAMLTMVAIMPSTPRAQETTTGAIEGQVIDAQGLTIPGATIIVTGAQGAKTFVTDAEGRFLAPFLTPACIQFGSSCRASGP